MTKGALKSVTEHLIDFCFLSKEKVPQTGERMLDRWYHSQRDHCMHKFTQTITFYPRKVRMISLILRL
jgi:hypothetical protein